MSKIILSINDVDEKMLELIDEFEYDENFWGVKVHELEYLSAIKSRKPNLNVMYDPKFFDIPSSINIRTEKALSAGANLITIHGLSEYEIPSDFVSHFVGVTSLSSDSEAHTKKIYGRSKRALVRLIANDMVLKGLHSMVCPPEYLRSLSDIPLRKYVPGIRAEGQNDNDHSHALTPREAIRAGADFLIVGRPVNTAPDPKKALSEILKDIEGVGVITI